MTKAAFVYHLSEEINENPADTIYSSPKAAAL